MIDKGFQRFKFLCLLWIVITAFYPVHWQVAAQTSQNINVCKWQIDFHISRSWVNSLGTKWLSRDRVGLGWVGQSLFVIVQTIIVRLISCPCTNAPRNPFSLKFS